MTLGRRAPRTTGAIQPTPATRKTTAADGTYDGYIRGVSDLPPAIPNIQDRPIIQPDGKTHWKDIPVVRNGRRPSSVLTCLLKRNHPGVVDYDGAKVLATEWEDYHAVKETNGHSVADKIEDAFWLRYKYEDAYSEKAKQHVRRCFNEWCSEEWIAKSKKNRDNRVSSKFKPHKGGSNSMTTISQKMPEETGEEVNQIQAWVHTHRGIDESKPLILNTPEATKCLALYDYSNGKPHGKWPLFNGIVNDTEVIAELRATGASSAALKRRRAEEIEDVLQKESEKARKAEAYANNVLSWGVGMYEHCNGIQKFLQAFATNQGVPLGEIPPPPVPPPAHSWSPPGSPQQSTIQIQENSEELPPLCVQQHANPSSDHELDVGSNVPVAAQDEGMLFGGFFSECGTGALSLSLLGSQPVP
ncbi:hypothetical protein VPH35_000269 [Triticum aestivum]